MPRRQPVDRVDRFLRACTQALMPAQQPGEFRIGPGSNPLGCSFDPRQRLVEPLDRMGQPLICHDVLTITSKSTCKRPSLCQG